ncbi:TldD/PmbA family protein [Desulfofundulus sp.]|uniref:TldD/PmbA family protein n=1 Tax=Desulfofundulus sp. TaxID=2282750 RepID=UPI003C74E2CA
MLTWKGVGFALADFVEIARFALERAASLGADQAEAYLNAGKELVVEIRDGRVETMKLAQDRGLGLRVMVGNSAGFAFTTDLTKTAVEDIVSQAVSNASSAAPDPYRVLPEPASRYPELDLYDPAIRKATVEEKIELARAMERAARDFDPRVKIIESAAYHDAELEVTLVNSRGIEASYRSAYCGLYISVVAEENNDSQTGFAMDYGLQFARLNPGRVGREAAERAVRMLGAKPVTTRRATVILEPYVVTGFLGLLGPGLTAEAVQKNRSLFAGKVGQAVASPLVNIIDDGALAGGLASAPFDGEGVPTGRTVLIEGGVLRGFLHNTYTAAKDGVKSTGNGVRGSFKSPPEVGTTNFFIQPGTISHEDLIRDTHQGLYVTEVLGMHTANPISGDFSVGAAGILIENGQLTRPVRGVAIAGNLLDLLKQVDGVASNLTFFGGRGAPTIRVAAMSISGH